MSYIQEGRGKQEHDEERIGDRKKTQIELLEKNVISEMKNPWIELTTV